MMSPERQLSDDMFDVSTPLVRPDVSFRRYDNEAVVWAIDARAPVYLDPIAALVFPMLDGTVSIAELIEDVHYVLGVPTGIIRTQLRRIVRQLEHSAFLAPWTDTESPDVDLDLFTAPPNP